MSGCLGVKLSSIFEMNKTGGPKKEGRCKRRLSSNLEIGHHRDGDGVYAERRFITDEILCHLDHATNENG